MAKIKIKVYEEVKIMGEESEYAVNAHSLLTRNEVKWIEGVPYVVTILV